MKIEELKQLYDVNEDFREYVNRYSRKATISIDEAFTHVMVKEYAKWLMESKRIILPS